MIQPSPAHIKRDFSLVDPLLPGAAGILTLAATPFSNQGNALVSDIPLPFPHKQKIAEAIFFDPYPARQRPPICDKAPSQASVRGRSEKPKSNEQFRLDENPGIGA
jgi:hypothetical protein